jgi:hypothetical protein
MCNVKTNRENTGAIPDYMVKENEMEFALGLIIKDVKNVLDTE